MKISKLLKLSLFVALSISSLAHAYDSMDLRGGGNSGSSGTGPSIDKNKTCVIEKLVELSQDHESQAQLDAHAFTVAKECGVSPEAVAEIISESLRVVW